MGSQLSRGTPRHAVVVGLAALLFFLLYPGEGAIITGAQAAPKVDLPATQTCFAEPQIVAAARVPGRFFPVDPASAAAWRDALSQMAEQSLPSGDGVLVFITAAPHGTEENVWPAGSGNVFVMREGCVVWHHKLKPDGVLDLVDLVDVLVGKAEGAVTPVAGGGESGG